MQTFLEGIVSREQRELSLEGRESYAEPVHIKPGCPGAPVQSASIWVFYFFLSFLFFCDLLSFKVQL